MLMYLILSKDKTVPLIFVNRSICEKIKMYEIEFTGRNLIIYLITQSFNLTVSSWKRNIAWLYMSSLILIWSRWCLTKIGFVPHARCIVYHCSLHYLCSAKLPSYSSEKVFKLLNLNFLFISTLLFSPCKCFLYWFCIFSLDV